MNVQLCQLNNSYGNQVYFPYAIGILQLEAKKNPVIKKNVHFQPLLYKREALETIISKVRDANVLGLSCYIWNWRISLELAKKYKSLNPDGIVIIGGPQVPDEAKILFKEHPYLDFAVHGEAEETFEELIANILTGDSFKDIPGVSFNEHDKTRPFIPRLRKKNLDDLYSPYLEGEFDQIMKDNPNEKWMALWETNRGCPFKCTFCDWGMATGSKVVEFPKDRLNEEIKWFSDNKIEFIFGCDANFGIRSRDIDIAKELTRYKKNTGYPKDFRVCFTKNSTHKIFDLATIFNDSGMLKGVSLSMQSLDEKALKFIKRDNIKLNTFEELQKKYSDSNISTYTELIIGLPGETYNSFVDGVSTLLERGQHHQILVYNCSVMPNSEMGKKNYQEIHGIKTIESPIFQAHSSSEIQTDTITEYEPIIVETKYMSINDWKKIYKFSWAVQTFHTLGLLQSIAIFFRFYCNVSYKNFYIEFVKFCEKNSSIILREEIDNLENFLNKALKGKGFGTVLLEYSDISWPIEEATYLRLSSKLTKLFDEIKNFIGQIIKFYNLDIEKQVIDDLILMQISSITTYLESKDFIDLTYDIPGFIKNAKKGDLIKIKKGHFSYKVKDNSKYLNKKKDFAREIVWYGRKGGKFNRELELFSKKKLNTII